MIEPYHHIVSILSAAPLRPLQAGTRRDVRNRKTPRWLFEATCRLCNHRNSLRLWFAMQDAAVQFDNGIDCSLDNEELLCARCRLLLPLATNQGTVRPLISHNSE